MSQYADIQHLDDHVGGVVAVRVNPDVHVRPEVNDPDLPFGLGPRRTREIRHKTERLVPGGVIGVDQAQIDFVGGRVRAADGAVEFEDAIPGRRGDAAVRRMAISQGIPSVSANPT